MPELIHHIGFLVADLEAAIVQWEKATGYRFSEIGRYRTDTYADDSAPHPHPHDARISFSKEGPPYIELMEFHGQGTHSASHGEGIHHLGFMDHPDVEGRRQDLEAAGMRCNGIALDEDGKTLLWFTDKDDLHGVRLEFVSPVPQPIVMDDGGAAHRDGRGFPSLWPVEPPV
ncbi:VOC family protein [Streptomyces sp. NPDC002181]|uniref:VOC family protein n=1 Tax=unclassified Streptomyces TaxID=2593676 RepID=UPI00364C647F